MEVWETIIAMVAGGALMFLGVAIGAGIKRD